MKRKKQALEGFDLRALCPEAQADGVPCPDLGRECEHCERALAELKLAQEDAPVLGEEDEEPSKG